MQLRFVRLGVTAAAAGLAALAVGAPASASSSSPAHAMGTVKAAHSVRPKTSSNLSYHGGAVETAPKVFVVFWGSQWTGNDPSGEASILQSFLGNVGGSNWNNSVTQYCQGTSTGSTATPCTGTGAVGNPKGMATSSSFWYDGGSAAPSSPSQSQLAAEAARAAGHFGVSTQAEYVVATATGDSQSGFGTSWCAYHSSTSAGSTTIAWTYLPYITDAGASCGANFVNSGTAGLTDGITIVEGHEMAESETDPFPSSGWLDSRGSENGDKCAWNSATSDQQIGSGTYPVQPLWSNVSSSCVLSYP